MKHTNIKKIQLKLNKAISKSKQVYENMRGILERYNKK